MSGYEVKIGHAPKDIYGNSEQHISADTWGTDSATDKDWDAARGGASVQTESGHTKVVTSGADLQGTDRIVVMGIPMTVKQARDMGFGDQIDQQVKQSAESFKSNDAALRDQIQAQQFEQDKQEYERASKVELGLATYPELNAAETVGNTLKLHAGLNEEAAAELVLDTLTGTVQLPEDTFAALAQKGVSKEGWHSMVEQGQKLVTDAAKRELGHEKFNRLQQLAKQSASINKVVIEHGIKRSRGKATLSWNQVLELAEQYVSR